MSRQRGAVPRRENQPRPRLQLSLGAPGRWLWVGTVSVVSVAALATILFLGMNTFQDLVSQPIRKVSVQGEFRYLRREQITARLDDRVSKGLMAADLDAIREALAADPWVDRTVVRRRWPDQLEISLTEQIPIAYWGDQALVNYRGELFRPDSIPVIEGLPILYGPEGSSAEVMRRYQELGNLLNADGLSVVRVEMDERHAWRFWLRPGIEVVVGQGEVPEKLGRLLLAWRAELKEYLPAIERIDLRYGNGLAVGWHGGQAPWQHTVAPDKTKPVPVPAQPDGAHKPGDTA